MLTQYRNDYRVRTYGAKGDGIADDTAAIQATINDAATGIGGNVVFDEGIYICSSLALRSNVHLIGCGSGVTTIKLKNGANTDLFSAQTSSINLSASFGAGSTGTLSNFSVQGLTLDGNKANQSSGTSYPLRFYGYGFLLRDVEIQNGYSGGALIDWNGNLTSGMEALIDNCTFHDSNGIGLQMGGPHDSRLNDCFSYTNTSHGYHFAPNDKGTLCKNVHPYHLSTGVRACGFLIEANGVCLIDCECEGADFIQVALLGVDCGIIGGQVFSNPPGNVVGVQMGQLAGQTPIPGQILQSAGATTAMTISRTTIFTRFLDCQSGAIDFQNEIQNTIIATIHQTSGTALHSNHYPDKSDSVWWNIAGLTTDNTLNTSNAFRMSGSNNKALLIQNVSGTEILNFDAQNSILHLPNSTQFEGWSDNYSTQTYLLKSADGSLYLTGNVGVHTGVNSGIAALVTTGADNRKGLVIYPNSATQSADLFEVQDQNFANIFAIASKNGGGGNAGLGAAVNSGILLLASPFANNMKGLVIYPFSSSQTANLLEIQNASFTPVFTVDLNGNLASTTIATSQSISAPTLVTNGIITTANTDKARVAPTGNVTGIILQSGTVAGQEVVIVNESAFTVTFDIVGTSHVADGVSAVIAANRCMFFVWDSSTSKWYHA